jgi:hypothetical protein
MPRVIAHPRHSLDHLRHAGPRPQICVEAVRTRAVSQGHVDLPQLLGVQTRQPGPARAAPWRRQSSIPETSGSRSGG